VPLETTSTTQDDPVNPFKQQQDQQADIDKQFLNLPKTAKMAAGKKVDKDAINRRMQKEGQLYASNQQQ